ncbi:MAG: MlrC C-terminal domain-containing protein, partial [Eubacteriales bacterium]|nr:MlrC C-terminal domain-containing protein [Eubacteriales bacterium]
SLLGRQAGDAVQVEVGAGIDGDSAKVAVSGSIKCFGALTHHDTGQRIGSTVTLDLGAIDLIVEDKPQSFTTMSCFADAGVDADAYDIIVVKQGYLFPELEQIAKLAILCLSPGASNQLVAQLPFRLIPRPTYPMDELE